MLIKHDEIEEKKKTLPIEIISASDLHQMLAFCYSTYSSFSVTVESLLGLIRTLEVL